MILKIKQIVFLKGLPAFIISLFCVSTVSAQFVKGVGLMLGADYSTQNWKIKEPAYSAKQKYIFGGNGSVFVEYIDHRYYRLVTEAQYFMEGSKSKLTGDLVRTNYFCFNQFFKIRQELYDVTPYALIGPKFELLSSQSFLSGFKSFHLGAYAAVGMEFLYKKPWIFLAEAGYSHDLNKAMQNALMSVTNKAWVLRVGIKYEPKRKVKGCRTGGSRPDINMPKQQD